VGSIDSGFSKYATLNPRIEVREVERQKSTTGKPTFGKKLICSIPGYYMCQINTEPTISQAAFLDILSEYTNKQNKSRFGKTFSIIISNYKNKKINLATFLCRDKAPKKFQSVCLQ